MKEREASIFRKVFLSVLPFNFKIVEMDYNIGNDTSLNILFW